jgi:hypothetical protein
MQLFDAKARVSSSIQKKVINQYVYECFPTNKTKGDATWPKKKAIQIQRQLPSRSSLPCMHNGTRGSVHVIPKDPFDDDREILCPNEATSGGGAYCGGMHSIDREEWQWWIDAIHPNDPEPQQPHSFSHAPSCPLLHLHAASSFPSSSATVRVCG